MRVFRLQSCRSVGVFCLGLLDLLVVVAFLIMLLAWLLNPFRFNLGPMHLTIHGGLKPILILVFILGARQILAWALARGTEPVRTLWDRTGCRTAILFILDVLFVATLLLIPVVWLVNPLTLAAGVMPFCITWWLRLVLAPLLIIMTRLAVDRLAFRSYPHFRGLWESAIFKKICLALITTYVFFALFESVLVWTQFNAALPPIVFQGKNNVGGSEKPQTLPDAELIFRFQPGSYFQGRLINSMGFRDREVDPRKKPGTIRVVCMGDSVTGQGRPGYSQYLHERLTNNPPTPSAWEAFNMGVHGYSSLQGLRLFQKQGRLLTPDIVTLYYGWNDHWLTDEPDRQRMGLEMRPFAGQIFELLRQKRIFRFVVWALNPIQHVAVRDRNEDRVLRVAPDEYHSTLKAFVREIRAAGAIPILITAPRRPLTQEVIGKQYVTSVEQGNRTHDEYVEITRRVARESNVELLDLAGLFTNQACNGYFARDGIHFDYYAQEGRMTNDPPSQPGLMHVAEELDRKVREITRTPAWQSHIAISP